MAWFKKTRTPIASSATEKPSRVPEGLWVKCPGCAQVIYKKDLEKNLSVCPKCAHHFRLSAAERLQALFDDAEWTEHFAGLTSNNPLQFADTKLYRDRLRSAIKATGLNDAIIVATGRLDGLDVVIGAMEYSFIGGSMGVVMGEKLARAVEIGLDRRIPVIIVSCSGGARMMEGATGSRQAPLHFNPDRPDDRWRHGKLRHAGRSEHRRAEGAHRVCGSARDRADDSTEAARWIPAQRVPCRARHARPGRRPARHEGRDRSCPPLHARGTRRRSLPDDP